MVHMQVINKASHRPQNKTSRNIRKKRDKRLTAGLRAGLRQLLHLHASVDLLQRDLPRQPLFGTQRHFDDVVMSANSADEVLEAFAKLPPGTNLTYELARAIDARYKRLEHDMGFATSGLRRMVCLGALCMSVVGLALAVSGLHLGALSLACGASALGLFIVLALVTYGYRCVLHRHTTQGRVELAQHRAVLMALRSLCTSQKIMPDATCRVVLDRCVSVINGNVGFVALEVLRGTILELVVSACGTLRRKIAAQRAARDRHIARHHAL